MKQKSWELFYLRVIRKHEKGIVPFFLRFFLWLLTFPYRLAVRVRNFAYDKGWLSRYTPPTPLVISIGNLVVGGAGKTPVTLMIAEAFYLEFPLAILARGYRSESERLTSPIVVCRGQGPTHPATYAGDEAYLMAENLPKSIVVVGRNRRESSSLAAKMGAKLILLDDGMQHRRVQRDKEVVVMDLNDPWGLGYFLPRGLLREGKSGLKRADLIVLNHTGDHKAFEKLKIEISKVTSAPVVGTIVEVVGVFDLANRPIALKGHKVGVFCGIAHPEYFVKTVKSLHAEIVGEHFLGDHHGLSLETLLAYSHKMRSVGADFLLCTEKDKVKLSGSLDESLPIAWVKMKLKVVEGKSDYDAFIAKGREVLKVQS